LRGRAFSTAVPGRLLGGCRRGRDDLGAAAYGRIATASRGRISTCGRRIANDARGPAFHG